MSRIERSPLWLIIAIVLIVISLVTITRAQGAEEQAQTEPLIPLAQVKDVPYTPPAEPQPSKESESEQTTEKLINEKPSKARKDTEVYKYTQESESNPETGLDSPKQISSNNEHYSASYFKKMGVIHSGGYRWTWYSQRVLPGGGLKIEGRHVDSEGYVCDSKERAVLASVDLGYGTVVDIPFGSGKGIVLDSGCPSGTLDVYTDW